MTTYEVFSIVLCVFKAWAHWSYGYIRNLFQSNRNKLVSKWKIHYQTYWINNRYLISVFLFLSILFDTYSEYVHSPVCYFFLRIESHFKFKNTIEKILIILKLRWNPAPCWIQRVKILRSWLHKNRYSVSLWNDESSIWEQCFHRFLRKDIEFWHIWSPLHHFFIRHPFELRRISKIVVHFRKKGIVVWMSHYDEFSSLLKHPI